MSVIDEARQLPGQVLTRGDDGFEAALAAAVWNGDIARQPVAIVRPASPAEVAEAVLSVRRLGVDLTVRGGGHSFAGHAAADDAVMIDLSRMNGITVDVEAQRVHCEAGASWAELDAATTAQGLAVPGGFISHTGVAGLSLGGGMGWLNRLGGLSCDNIVSAQVVTADGRIVAASAEENPDLFWALRGGGGNFGIVTSFEFAAYHVSPMANLGLFFWRPEDAKEPLQLARTLIASLPDEFGAFVAGLSAPPAPFVPPESQGAPGVAIAIVNWGSAEDHERAAAPLRDLHPLFELVTPIPHTALQQMFDESAPWGILAYEKAIYLDDLEDGVIDILIKRLPTRVSPMTFVPIFPLGGKYARVPDEDTAFGGSRATRWTFNIAAVAADPDSLAADTAWVREFWDELRPYANDAGGYINFLADVDESRVKAAYGAKYDRLAAIKAVWDPDNVFHHNANIQPAASSATP
jgi:FAD/FMN-containing dehydrogenase